MATLTASGGVGRARGAGIDHLAQLTPMPAEQVWIATTDADTLVPPTWLIEQIRRADAGADAIFGVVDVEDWAERPPSAARRFAEFYQGAAEGDLRPHPHVHGANLGVRLSAYRQVGGFDERLVGEDQSLSDRLDAQASLRVERTTALRVVTSARTDPRAALGFGDLLTAL